MGTILLEEKYALQYIKHILYSIITKPIIINSKYHHNTEYEYLVSICKNGILTMSELSNLNIKNYSEEILKTMSDIDSHANGIDSISLAVMGLKDLYSNEEEYNPYNPSQIDLIVSSDIRASRFSQNYGNEFIHHGSIDIGNIKAIDIRLLKLIELMEKNIYNHVNIKSVIEKYNHIKDAALIIRELNIYLREMSFEDGFKINIDKLIEQPKIFLK